jgi:hypothetical protein
VARTTGGDPCPTRTPRVSRRRRCSHRSPISALLVGRGWIYWAWAVMTALIVVQQGGIVAGVVTAAKVQAGAQVGNLWLRGRDRRWLPQRRYRFPTCTAQQGPGLITGRKPVATGVIKTVSHCRSVRSMQADGGKQLLAGSLPRRQARLVEAWAELHQSDLVAD